MKQILSNLYPLSFALANFFFYILVFRPNMQSGDFTTALMVFFTALGSSALIVFYDAAKRFLRVVHSTLALGIQVIIVFIFPVAPVEKPHHFILLGLIFLSFIFLRFFYSQVPRDRVTGEY